jgi:hypothetical protein
MERDHPVIEPSENGFYKYIYIYIYTFNIVYFSFIKLYRNTIYGLINALGYQEDCQQKEEKLEGLNENGVCDGGLDNILLLIDFQFLY